MRLLLVLLLAAHGALHALGFAKAFGLADIPRLRRGIPPEVGVLWLAATLLLLAGAALLAAGHRLWWAPTLPGVLLSQALIFTAWSDARFGTVANLVFLVPLALAVADLCPDSLRATFHSDVKRDLARPPPPAAEPVTEADLAHLPPQLRTYLHRAGVVGRPRVHNLHAVFHARLRAAPDAPWMAGRVEQYEFFAPVERLFFMHATRAGLPVDVFHRFAGRSATMRARVAGVLPLLDVAGPEMTQSETVTLLNDMLVLAPATLVDAPVRWEVLDERRVRAVFTHAGHTVSGVAVFDEAGDLVDFHSDDRYQLDGRSRRLLHWATPLHGYRDFGGVRLAAAGEARWTEPAGEWTYGEMQLERIEYNVPEPAR